MENINLIILIIAAWAGLCIYQWRAYTSKNNRGENRGSTAQHKQPASMLVVYASQTGKAESLALQFAAAMGLSAQDNVLAINQLSITQLSQCSRILFVVSTYGNGEPPDNGLSFEKRLANTELPLSHLAYSVVALGDSAYPDFCSFGFHLHQLLEDAGSQPLAKVITVNNYQSTKVELATISPPWLPIIASHNTPENELPIAGDISTSDLKPSIYWKITSKQVLNAESDKAPLVQINLENVTQSYHWQAGDVIDVLPKHNATVINAYLSKFKLKGDEWVSHQGTGKKLRHWLADRELSVALSATLLAQLKSTTPQDLTSNKGHHVSQESLQTLLTELPTVKPRSYSIASIPQQGQIQLILRLFKKADNTPGLASTYLANDSDIGDIIQGDIRSVPAHHQLNYQNPLILIGAGSGLAGLKAHIEARAAQRVDLAASPLSPWSGKTWLIYGERNALNSLPLNQQLKHLSQSKLSSLSCAYSQYATASNTASNCAVQSEVQYTQQYVQDIISQQQNTLKEWLDNDACLYICGSFAGMGKSVHQTLVHILGDQFMDELSQQGRYIRDLY